MDPKTVQQQSPLVFLGGSPGRILALNNFDTRALRTNTLLRHEEWVQIDTAVQTVARQRLGVVDALRRRGLVHPLGNLGVLVSEWERLGDFTDAEQSMSARARGQKDTPNFDLQAVPIPLTFKDFDLDIRRLQASRNLGSNIDTTSAQLASMVVAEKLEDTVVNGSTVAVGGNIAYGFTNHGDRNQGSLGAAWDDSGYDGEDILADVIAMLGAAAADLQYGPFMLVIPAAYDAILGGDYKAASDKTIRQRLLELEQLQQIVPTSKLTADNVLLVQLLATTVDLAIAQDIVTVEWTELGGFVSQFRVFAAMAPRVKSDKEGHSGIVHFTA